MKKYDDFGKMQVINFFEVYSFTGMPCSLPLGGSDCVAASPGWTPWNCVPGGIPTFPPYPSCFHPAPAPAPT